MADTRYVPIRFPLEVFEALHTIAEQDRSLWYDHGPTIGERPSVSAAVRQLVNEALKARGAKQ